MDAITVRSCADCPLAFMSCIVGDNQEPRCNHPQNQNVKLADENDDFPNVVPDFCPLKRESLKLTYAEPEPTADELKKLCPKCKSNRYTKKETEAKVSKGFYFYCPACGYIG